MKLSIIVPVYNTEAYLKRCIESILQSFPNVGTSHYIEVILVDDGSKDGSGKICDQYSEEYSYVHTIHKKNGGLAEARNIGLSFATGDYIFFIDSDDYLFGNLLFSFQDALLKYPELDIFCFDYKYVYDDNGKSDDSNQEKIVLLDKRKAYKLYLEGKTISRMAWDKVYRKNIFNGIEYPKGYLAEDYATTYKLLARSNLIVKTNRCFYGYYQRPDSIMGKKSIKLILDEYRIGQQYYRFNAANFRNLRKYYNTEHINLLIKTYSRIETYMQNCCIKNEKKEVMKRLQVRIDRECQSLLFAKCKLRTKTMQIIFLFYRSIALKLMRHKDMRDWYKSCKKSDD